MREWNTPAIEELEISNTEWDQAEGTRADSWYVDNTKTPAVKTAYKYHGNSAAAGL